MENVKRILAVCGTGSDCRELLQKASSLARDLRGKLLVLTVVYNPFGVKGLSFPRPSLDRDEREMMEKIRRDMQEFTARERLQGTAVQAMIREGRPLRTILKTIMEEKIDLVVLPAHEESRLEHLLFGRKNKVLLRKMPCSILFMKSEPSAVEEEQEEEAEEEEAA